MSEAPRIALTPASVGFFLSIVSVLTIGWNSVGYLTGLEQKNVQQDLRLDRTDEDRANNTEALKEQTVETQRLKEAVVKLTTVIGQTDPNSRRSTFLFPRGSSDVPPLTEQN